MSSTSKLIAAFVLLIIGIVLAAEVAVVGLGVTAKTGAVDESFNYEAGFIAGQVNETSASSNRTLTNQNKGWKTEDCPITGVSVTNSSGTALVLDTDYEVYASSGIIRMLNTTDTNTSNNVGNASLIDYTYCGDDYMNLGWGRTGINLIPGFFALALLIFSVGLFYSIAKENGIIS